MQAPTHQKSSDSTPFEKNALTTVQAQIVAALAAGTSVTAAARKAGIHRTTIHLWNRTSREFRAAVEQARSDYAAALADELRDISTSAFDTLRALLANADTPPSVRLRAALAVLEDPAFPKPGWQPGDRTAPLRGRSADERFEDLEAEYDRIMAARAAAEGSAA